MEIRVAQHEDDVRRCHAVMAELRPHLDVAAFAAQVARQQASGYEIALLEADGAVQAVAGFRVQEMLHSGKQLYVDDLVTAGAARSRGYGAALLEWLVARARATGCATVELDSGVQRFAAHRFYFREGMHISSYHFRLKL